MTISSKKKVDRSYYKYPYRHCYPSAFKENKIKIIKAKSIEWSKKYYERGLNIWSMIWSNLVRIDKSYLKNIHSIMLVMLYNSTIDGWEFAPSNQALYTMVTFHQLIETRSSLFIGSTWNVFLENYLVVYITVTEIMKKILLKFFGHLCRINDNKLTKHYRKKPKRLPM